jgi:hypothetical protein
MTSGATGGRNDDTLLRVVSLPPTTLEKAIKTIVSDELLDKVNRASTNLAAMRCPRPSPYGERLTDRLRFGASWPCSLVYVKRTG